MGFVEELKWRGLLHDIIPGTEEYLLENKVAGYIGFDPTSTSLTIGNLVQIMLLVHFQKHGHKPIALVGGATGMIGDPSGKSQERNLLSKEKLDHNLNCLKNQLSKFIDFDGSSNSAEMVNNYDWFAGVGFLDFLRDVGKHLTVSYMMAKDSVKTRLESGISFTEFSYQLLQGYDFYHLNKNNDCKIQMGGSDQWGNITSGVELIRRKGGGSAFAITSPLVTKADGTKFGKSTGGDNMWLDPNMTSPYKFYQFWLNCSDEDSKNFIRIFSLKSRDEIESLEARQNENPHLRELQNALAEEITERVHSKEALDNAINATKVLFSKTASSNELKSLDEITLLDVFNEVPSGSINREKVISGVDISDFLCSVGAFSSKGEAKRMIKQGGLKINKDKFTKLDGIINESHLLNEKYILIQKGKKSYHLVKTEA